MARLLKGSRLSPSKAPAHYASDIDAFIAFMDLERGLSRNTRENYQRDLDQAAAFLDKHKVKDWRAVSEDQASAWLRDLSESGMATASLARKLTAVRVFARFLVREGLRPDDFTALLAGPKISRRLPETLSAEEVTQLMKAPQGGDPPSLRDRALMELFYSSGLRVTELASLNIQHIDLSKGF